MAKQGGFFLSLLNFIFLVAGTAMATVAGLLLGRDREYGALLGGHTFTLPLAILFVGVGLLLLSLLAWVGILHSDTCFLYTYGIVLLVMVIVEVVGITLLSVYKEKVEEAVQHVMTDGFEGHGDEENLAVTLSLDRAQRKLECCGVLSFLEWNSTFGTQNGDVPDACCRVPMEGCGRGVLLQSKSFANQTLHSRGCYAVVRERVASGFPATIAVVSIFIFMQLICIYYAFSIPKKLRITVTPQPDK